MKFPLILSVFAVALSLPAGVVLAADAESTADKVEAREQIYGSQLMTQQERAAFHARMRAAKTAQEREQIRVEHHEQMKVRAKERGVTLPDIPPAGDGMGPGGGGMGPSGGRGR